ncbi:hypothetical protein [Nitrosomonas sp. ANs5]
METDSALPGNLVELSGVMDNQRYIESREGVPQGRAIIAATGKHHA